MNVTCRFNHVTQIYYHSNIIWVCSTTSCRSCDPESDVAPSKHQSSIPLTSTLLLNRCWRRFYTLHITYIFKTTLLSLLQLHYTIADFKSRIYIQAYNIHWPTTRFYNLYNTEYYDKKHHILHTIEIIKTTIFSHLHFLHIFYSIYITTEQYVMAKKEK